MKWPPRLSKRRFRFIIKLKELRIVTITTIEGRYESIIYIGMDVHNNTYSLCGVHSLTGDIVAQTKCATDVNYIHKFIKSVKERMSEENNYDIFMKERGILWQKY